MHLFKRAMRWFGDIVNPKQRWLTKQIPRYWVDKCDLIPEMLFAAVIHFVQEEDGLTLLARQIEAPGIDGKIDPQRSEEYSRVESDIRAAYEWALSRDKLFSTASFEKELVYRETDILQMESIVRHHRHLWT